MTERHFRVDWIIRGLSMVDEPPLTMTVGDAHRTEVTIRHPASGIVAGESQYVDHTECRATSVRTTSEAVANFLGSPPPGRAEWSAIAPSVRASIDGACGELVATLQRAGLLLRWVTAHQCPAQPFSSTSRDWSVDGEHWHSIPQQISVHCLGGGVLPRLSTADRRLVGELLATQTDEPVHRKLFLEAWELRSDNPASSLVIGVASLEVAIKSLISSLVPDAEWLAFQAPTPPVVRMLKEYLPKLPVRRTFGGKALRPSDELLVRLRAVVNRRNAIAHQGSKPPAFDNLEADLRDIEDCLWLVDYYSGQEWALNHVRSETLNGMRT